MTAFSLPTFDDPFKVPPIEAAPETTFRPPRKVRQVATDTAIQANRVQTPQDVSDARAVKRLSIGELNAADMPTLMERYQAHRYDDRGAVTRFLDLLDMPRNVLVSTVFPSIRRRKEAEGDVGTFGLGNVRFSDVLDELGVENRVVKGVVGFIGDVALDPLTYVGPGAVGKIVGKGGRVVETTVEGNRAFNAAFKAAARGKAVADETAAQWLRASGYTEEALAAKRASGMSAKQIEKELRAATYGNRSVANKVGGALGFDLQTSGSALADAFHSPVQSAQADAARAFIAKYGRGSAKGYQFGRTAAGKIGLEAVGGDTGKAAGSYLAHIPFTSYGLFVPPFTGEATRAAAMLQQAKSAFTKAEGPLGEDVRFFGQPLSKIQELRNEVPRNRARYSAIADKDIPEANAIHESVAGIHEAAKEDTKAARIAAKKAREEYEAIRDAHDEAMAAASGKTGNVAIGQQVQWTSQGVGQFAEPRTVEAFHLAPDNTLYAKLSGSDTMVPHAELHSWSPPSGVGEVAGPWYSVDDHAADLSARISAKEAAGMDRAAAAEAVQAELSASADALLANEGAILEDREGIRYRVEHTRSRSGGPKDRRALRMIAEDGTEHWIDPDQSRTMARSMRRVSGGASSGIGVDVLKAKKTAAHDAYKKARDEYRQTKRASDMARAARDASAGRRNARVAALKAERDQIAERMRSISGNDGVRADTLQKAKNIVTATDPHVALGSVVEGLDASRAQNKLNSIGDVLWQHDQLQKKLADARALMLDNATTIEQVEDRKRILSALGPEVDAEVAAEVDKARKEWEATRGGLFDPMPELNEDELALVLTEQGPEAAAELRANHAKSLSEWERNNKFHSSEVAADIRQRVMERRTAGFDEATKALINMPQDKADDMEAIASLIHDEFAIRMAQAEAMGGTLMEAAKNTDNTALAYIAADLIGLKDTVGGHSMFTSVRNIAKNLFGDTNTAAQMFFNKYDAMTELARSTFSLGNGEAHKMVRMFESQAKRVRDAAVQQKADAIRKGVVSALERNGIDPGRFAEAERVLFPMMVLKMDPTGQHWSLFNSEIEQALKDAKAAGLGPAFDDLMRLGEEHVDALRSMTDDELLSGVLGAQREAYLPGNLTREGAENARNMTPRRVGETPTGVNAEMGFNTPLQTTRATWQSVRDGETKQVYRFKHDFYSSFIDEAGRLTTGGAERLQQAAADARLRGNMAGAAGFNAEFWAKWNQNPLSVTADEVSRLSEYEQGIVRAADYNALPIEERMTTAKFKFVDPITKNRDLTSEFAMTKPGVNLPRGLFEESLAESLASRAGAHEFGMIRKQFASIIGGYAQSIPKAAIDDPTRLKIGDEIPFANGSRGRIIKAGSDYVIEVGGERFRRLRDLPNVRESLEKMGSGVYDSKAIDIVYPEKVAEALERFAQVEKDPGTVLRIYDQALRYWKGTTLAHASWVVGDILGGVFQMLMMGIPPTKIISRLRDGFRIAMAHDKEAMLKTLGVEAGGMGAEELAKAARNGGILSGHAHGESFLKLMDAGVYLPAYSQDLTQAATWKDPIGAIKTRFSEMRGRASRLHDIDMTNQVFARIPYAAKISKAWRLGVDEGFINHFAAPWFALNGRANDGMRMTAMLALMDDGHDFGGATMKVLNGMFDMENMSHVEKLVFKRMIPFYSWMKHSGLYWTKRMLQNPALLSLAPRVKDSLEESIYGDDRVPEYLRPNWMRDQMALQVGFNPDSRYALTLGTLVPTEMATAIGAAAASPGIGVTGLKQLAENVGFGLTLPLKMLIETATGREMFSNREIGFNPSEGDLSYGEYLASQARPLREFGIGNIRQGPIQKAAEAGAVPLASRLLLGGRSQPFDDERIRQNMLREFKQAEQSIRKRVTIAQREGNQGASVEARARLLRLYAEMAQKGLGDQVPAWARGQLPQVAGGS